MTSPGNGNVELRERYNRAPSNNLTSRNVPEFLAHSRGDRNP